MNKRDTLLALLALGAPFGALAQQQGKRWLIGWLLPTESVSKPG